MYDDLANMKAREIAAKIHAREIFSTETAEYFLDRIEKLNPDINTFSWVASAIGELVYQQHWFMRTYTRHKKRE